MRFDFTLPIAGGSSKEDIPPLPFAQRTGEYWSMTGERTFAYFVRLDDCLYAA